MLTLANWTGAQTVVGANGMTYLGNGTTSGTLKDPNGNQITTDSNGNFTDTLGQTALSISGTYPTYLQYAAPNGSSAKWTISYTPYNIQTNFGCSGIAEYSKNGVELPTKITLPDSTYYSFAYEDTVGHSGYKTGRLASVTLPTGGSITYNYPNNGTTNSINCADGSAPVASGSNASMTRTLSPGGTWNYYRTPVSGNHWQTKVTSPPDPSVGDDTIIDFQQDNYTGYGATHNFYETQRQVYQGSSSSGTLLSTSTMCYNANYSNCTTTVVTSPITQRDYYTQPAGGQWRLSETLYNGYGLVTDDKEYDYGATTGSAPGTTHLILETATTYGSRSGTACTALGNGIVSKPCQVISYDWSSGSQVTLASSTYSYDQGTLQTTSGTPQHVSIGGSRGNLTTVLTAAASNASLSKTFTYFDTGNVQTATDVNGAQTTYNYSDATSTCGNAFPTSVSEPLSLSRSVTWNCTGAVTTQLTDENTNAVNSDYTKDPAFWRPDRVTDQIGNQTSLSFYVTPNATEATLNFNGNISTSDSRTTVDGFGRIVFSQRLQGQSGSNYDTTEIDYDNLGRPYRSTMPFTETAPPSQNSSAPGKTTTYDALGRVLSVKDNNGGQVTYTYTANDVLQQVSGTQAFQKQYEYDGLGRLTSVCEMSSTLLGIGTCGQHTTQKGYWTKYTYDALGHLLTVKQNAQASSGSQNRAFTYDMMGRVASETNPETGNNGVSGTTTYTYDVVSSGNCVGTFVGDLVKKVDAAGNVSCYTYDTLHRATLITYPAGPNATATPAKFFWYDTPYYGSLGTNIKGRLVTAGTCQTNTSCAGSSVVREDFGYSPRGEITDIWETTPHSGGAYHTTAAFWATGALKTLGGIPSAPTIYYGASDGSGLDGEGRITQVTDSSGRSPVTGVTYAPATTNSNYAGPLGSLTGVTFGSGDSDSFGYDLNTGRMTGYLYSVNAKTDVGTLTWNTNGTLGKLVISDQIPGTSDSQTCTYGYDDLKRISNVTCGTFWVQNFTYDAFGNIIKNVPSGDGGLSFLPRTGPHLRPISSTRSLRTHSRATTPTATCSRTI